MSAFTRNALLKATNPSAPFTAADGYRSVGIRSADDIADAVLDLLDAHLATLYGGNRGHYGTIEQIRADIAGLRATE